jgi:hypothetical protein
MQEGKEIKAFVYVCFLTYGLRYQKKYQAPDCNMPQYSQSLFVHL